MRAGEYRNIIRIIVRNAIKQTQLKKKDNHELENVIAKNIHARLYGANVDGVASPLWRNENDKQPDVDASKLLEVDT